MKRVVWLFLITCCYAQQTLTPTELEQAQLAKLRAQNDVLTIQLQQIDTQLQALSVMKQLTQEHQQQKYSEYLGQANKVKEAHKDWGDGSKVSFNPQQGESGTFIKQPEEKKPTEKK